MSNELRVFSHGGGWQSVAVAVLQVQGKLKNPFDVFVWANVGDKSEPETLAYHRNVLTPYLESNNIRVVEVDRRKRDGSQNDLYDAVMRDDRSIPIPAYVQNGAPGNRTCTSDWKINIVDKWIKEQRIEYVVVGLGISMDESERMRPDKMQWHTQANANGKGRKFGFNKRVEYPLINDYRVWREDIPAIIESSGLPMPPKSACWFCPFSSRTRWLEMRQNNPERFALAVAMENKINEKRASLGKDVLRLHTSNLPLEIAVADQPSLFDFETGGGCNSGVCFT